MLNVTGHSVISGPHGAPSLHSIADTLNTRGMSQEKLGEALGLTFQQVQKYEKGINRISASRLQQISKTLNVTPQYLFEGLGEGAAPPGFAEPASSDYVVDFLSTSEGLLLNKA